jgi:hypothetical protein
MATKADFSETEWQALHWAVMDTMAYLSMADPGFMDMFKEANAAAKYIAAARVGSDSAVVRQLASEVKAKRDKSVSSNPADIAGQVAERVREAAGIVAGKAPEDLDEFKAFILGVAKATAEAAKGVSTGEAKAIEKLEAALG